MALVTTVLFAILGAVMVIVAISAYLSSSRLAAAERDRAEAVESAESVLSTYEVRLGEDPLYFLHRVSPYEEARVCELGVVPQVVQPGEPWPDHCGTVWSYVKPSGVSDLRDDPFTRLRVRPPSPQQPYLTIQAVSVVGTSTVARERTLAPESVATSLIYSHQDLFMDAVARELDTPLWVSGDVYTGGRMYLPSEANVDFADALLMAEGGFRPSGAVSPSQDVRYFSGAQPQGAEEDLRRIVPTPHSPDRLVADLAQLKEIACASADQASDDGTRHMCIVPGEGLPQGSATAPLDVDPNWPSARTFLLTFKTVPDQVPGDEPDTDPDDVLEDQKIEIFYSTKAPGFVWDCQIRCSLPTLAATEVAEGSHMGADSFWTYVGEFDPPASGVIYVDGDVAVGLCGDAFLTEYDGSTSLCDVSTLNTALTVVAGSAFYPKDVYLSGPIDASDSGGRLGVVSSGMTFIPYWARQPGGELHLDVAITALGLGDDISKGRFRGAVSTLPVRVHRGFVGAASNQASLLSIHGAIAGGGVDLSSNQYDSIRLEWDPRFAQEPPPYFPSFLSNWRLRSQDAISPDSICDNCASYVVNG